MSTININLIFRNKKLFNNHCIISVNSDAMLCVSSQTKHQPDFSNIFSAERNWIYFQQWGVEIQQVIKQVFATIGELVKRQITILRISTLHKGSVFLCCPSFSSKRTFVPFDPTERILKLFIKLFLFVNYKKSFSFSCKALTYCPESPVFWVK